MDHQDRSKRNNLRINGIKEGKNKTREECEERVNCREENWSGETDCCPIQQLQKKS